MRPLKVVFDTNVFSPGSFEELARSPMLRLCKRGGIEAIYGDVFLEEMLTCLATRSLREILIRDWLPFLASSARAYGRDLSEIWKDELLRGQGPYARVQLSGAEQRAMLERLSRLSEVANEMVSETQAARDEEQQKKLAQRELSLSVRKKYSDALREIKHRRKADRPVRNTQLHSEFVDGIGRTVIQRFIDVQGSHSVANRWARDKARYPFFTQFALNMAFKEVHFMSDSNAHVDINAQADLDIMTHLLRADVFVTNEQGFARAAFEHLWRPKRRVVMTVSQFTSYLFKIDPSPEIPTPGGRGKAAQQ